jgi:murein tripeptide amidase MpaA
MAYQLLTKYSTDSAVKAIVDKFDFYITPVVNPDGKHHSALINLPHFLTISTGFVYTQTTNRLWRKNRQTVSGNSCVGRDINRNWPYKWELTGGASTNPCDETFKGRAAGDSPENKALKTQIDTLAAGKGITFYVDFHSYGQYILWRKFTLTYLH